MTDSPIATTKMSSRGQVVIPEEIRKRMGIDPGAQFVVLCGEENDIVMLKKISTPSKEEFRQLMGDLFSSAKAWAKQVGLTEDDITDAIKNVRAKK